MQIVLFEPQIPQNTGNIIRTCKVTGSDLILIEPIGFDISEKALRRAQLDYAIGMNIQVSPSIEEVIEQAPGPIYFLSSKGEKGFYEESYPTNTTLVFGNETSGLPETIMDAYQSQLRRLPMTRGARCLNLSNAVAVATYEVLRQNEFAFAT